MTNLHHKASLKCGGGSMINTCTPRYPPPPIRVFEQYSSSCWKSLETTTSISTWLWCRIDETVNDNAGKNWLMNFGVWGDSSTNAKNHWKTPWPTRRKVGVGYLIPISDHSSFSPHVAYASRCMLHFCVLTVRDRGSPPAAASASIP